MDEMIERVAKAIERACYDAAQEEGEYCTPAMRCGAGYAMFLADGTVQRLSPEDVWFRPAPGQTKSPPRR